MRHGLGWARGHSGGRDGAAPGHRWRPARQIAPQSSSAGHGDVASKKGIGARALATQSSDFMRIVASV